MSDVAFSPAWDAAGPPPRISAVVSSYRRPEFLAGLIDALSAQTLPVSDYEVVVVDNGSGGETWEKLVDLASGTQARMAVTRLSENRGPGGGRNHGVGLIRAPYVAFTDDDCLPAPGWLAAVLATLEAGHDVMQGQVQADPDERDTAGPWDHTKWITVPTPFFETCNVGYRVSSFAAVGGFDENDALTAQLGGRAFGEDALLAWNVQKAGGRATFAPDALVYHRVVPSSYSHLLHDQRNLVGFPGLGNRSPLVAKWFWHSHFLSRESALFDLAVACLIVSVVVRKPWVVLGALLGALPWLRARWPEAMARSDGRREMGLVRLAQYAVLDGVSLVSLLEGSVRHRRVLL
jgi:GT2 family glycosyltransferase